MKVGEYANGYLITQPFTNAGGGQSEWTFAQKSGVSYFIKRFLKPTYPVDGGPGSERTKADKRERCKRFEQHHRTVERLLKPLVGTGGNLVVTKDFFRVGAHYFKVTERVENTSLPLTAIAAMALGEKVALMLAVSNSLSILHRHDLVHGDLKPDNLLLRMATPSTYAVNLIDFDNCFAAGEPPLPDDLVGDPTYYSPELMSYLTTGAGGDGVAQSSDVFALGLVFSQYLTGQLPTGSHPGYLAESMLRGGAVSVPAAGAAAEPVQQLISRMTQRDRGLRPSIGDVVQELKAVRRTVKGLGSAPRTPAGPAGSPGLRGSLLRTTPETAPKLRGKLLGPEKKDPSR